MSFSRLSLNSFALLPGRCLCCGLPSHRQLDLCAVCEADLPRPGNQCPQCGIPLPESALCGECLNDSPAFSRTIVPFLYAPPIKGLVNQFKSGGNLAAGRVLGELLYQQVMEAVNRNDDSTLPELIIPMPLHWRRRFSRGFNQAHELARPLSKSLGIPIDARSLRRIMATPPQRGRSRKERLGNLNGAFVAGSSVAGRRIAIVDDVMTTGATTRASAHAVIKAGAKEVQIWCLARTAGKNGVRP